MNDNLAERFMHAELVEQVDGTWRLVGTRCSRCGDVRFPSALGCAVCQAGREELVREFLPGDGFVYTFSRVMKAAPPFKAPYILAWVQLDAGPRVLAQLDCPADSEVYGKRCELVLGTLWQTPTEIGVGYKFKPVNA
jgi:uncharacterized OB-fold protein